MAKYCEKCGSAIGETFKFCPACGAPVHVQEIKAKVRVPESAFKYVDYNISEDGEAVFSLELTIGKGEAAHKTKVEFGRGEMAKLCKNGTEAIDILQKEGYIFRGGIGTALNQLIAQINSDFEGSDEGKKVEVISSEDIAKLYKTRMFLGLLGQYVNLKYLWESIKLEFADSSTMEMSEVLKIIVKKELSIDLPLSNGELRDGEQFLLHNDYDNALDWYNNIVTQEDGRTGYNYNVMGQLYLSRTENENEATRQDYEEARRWLEKSSDSGDWLGIKNLGYVYENGKGVDVDLKKAFEYYTEAYKHGNKYARRTLIEFLHLHLVDVYEGGLTVEDNDILTIVADECEKENDKDVSLYVMGYMYQYGLGRLESIEKAVDCYRKLLGKNVYSRNETSDKYCLNAIGFLSDIRESGYDTSDIDENTKQTLRNIFNIENSIREYKEEKRFLEKQKFGEEAPKKPEYIGAWVIDGSVKYDDNICFSEAEEKFEMKAYKDILDIYNDAKKKWKDAKESKIDRLDNNINEGTSLKNRLNDSIKTKYQHYLDMPILLDYMESTGATLVEAAWTNSRKYFDNNRTQGDTLDVDKVVIHEGEGFNVVKHITEVIGELVEKEKEIQSLKNKDHVLTNGFDKRKPIKPAYRGVINKEAPSNHYAGRICETDEQYRKQLDTYLKELRNYYIEKLQWLEEQPRMRLVLKQEIDKLEHDAFTLYVKLDMPQDYRNLQAVEYISNYMSSHEGSLQQAFDAFDRKQLEDKEKARQEEEKRKREAEERARIQKEKYNRKMEEWDREFEEQEARRERYYDEKYGKKDLLGSTVCIKRFQRNVLDFEHSCRFCPQARNCTRA